MMLVPSWARTRSQSAAQVPATSWAVEPELLVAAAHLDRTQEHRPRTDERIEHARFPQDVAVTGQQRLEVRGPRLGQPDVQDHPAIAPVIAPRDRPRGPCASCAHRRTARE